MKPPQNAAKRSPRTPSHKRCRDTRARRGLHEPAAVLQVTGQVRRPGATLRGTSTLLMPSPTRAASGRLLQPFPAMPPGCAVQRQSVCARRLLTRDVYVGQDECRIDSTHRWIESRSSNRAQPVGAGASRHTEPVIFSIAVSRALDRRYAALVLLTRTNTPSRQQPGSQVVASRRSAHASRAPAREHSGSGARESPVAGTRASRAEVCEFIGALSHRQVTRLVFRHSNACWPSYPTLKHRDCCRRIRCSSPRNNVEVCAGSADPLDS
ncbi:MAG: hypothetical protein RL033_7187 [Pseudomonadota bacterium]